MKGFGVTIEPPQMHSIETNSVRLSHNNHSCLSGTTSALIESGSNVPSPFDTRRQWWITTSPVPFS